MSPQLYCNIFTIIAQILMNILFRLFTDLRLDGIAIANLSAGWICLISLIIFIKYHESDSDSWGPFFDKSILHGWGTILAFAVPGTLMNCTEWWLYDIAIFVAGYHGPLTQAAYGISWQLFLLALMVPYSFSIAVKARVTHLLMRQETAQAKLAGWSCLFLSLLWCILIGIVFFFASGFLGKIFTGNLLVIHTLRSIVLAIIIALAFDSIQATGSQIFHALGKEIPGTLINFVAYYIVGLPCIIIFSLRFPLPIFGVWSGIIVAVLSSAIAFSVTLLVIDWNPNSTLAEKVEHLTSSNTNYNSTSTSVPINESTKSKS